MENENNNNQLADTANTNHTQNSTTNTNEQKKRISIEMIFASLSLLISLFTFVITALQTQIMQNQQKAAVWAYLEATIGISGKGFYCEVQNKGVGAAIVEEVNYYYGSKKYKDFAVLAQEIIKDSTFNYDYYSTNPINKKVFAAGEKILVFGVTEMKFAEKLVRPHLVVEVRYTNIYGETFFYKSK